MRITLDVDENLLNQAMALSPGKTKDEVINEALALYVSRRRQETDNRELKTDN